ncbi:MAG TPA: ABC transporter permease [Actinomycetes bacterium]
MVWLTWRQHRAEALGGLLLLGAVAAILLAVGVPMHAAYHQAGIAACLGQPDATPTCASAIDDFASRFSTTTNSLLGLVPWLNFLPAVVGIFVGAPLLAREFEHDTWRLAWTQAVPRTRWLAVKLAVLLAAILALTTVLSGLFGWYRGPLDRLDGRLVASAFDFEGLSLPAYTLFAFALGTLAGILTRRTVLAMGATLAGFVAVRLPVEDWLRPHYQRPVTAIVDPLDLQHGSVVDTNLNLGRRLLDAGGHQLSLAQQRSLFNSLASTTSGTRDSLTASLHQHGYHWQVIYQPASRYWHFQLIEAALFTGLAGILLAVAIWQLHRRVG